MAWAIYRQIYRTPCVISAAPYRWSTKDMPFDGRRHKIMFRASFSCLADERCLRLSSLKFEQCVNYAHSYVAAFAAFADTQSF